MCEREGVRGEGGYTYAIEASIMGAIWTLLRKIYKIAIQRFEGEELGGGEGRKILGWGGKGGGQFFHVKTLRWSVTFAFDARAGSVRSLELSTPHSSSVFGFCFSPLSPHRPDGACVQEHVVSCQCFGAGQETMLCRHLGVDRQAWIQRVYSSL